MHEQENKPVLIKEIGFKVYGKIKKTKYALGLFKCSCGNIFEATITSINCNQTKSCGCYRRKRRKNTHQMCYSRLYTIWHGIIQRCKNKNNAHYKNYGEKGVTICDRWLSFSNFIEDMYPTYKDGLTIDRINPNGDYEPSNCRWATRITQNRNTRLLRKTNTSGYRGVEYLHQNKNGEQE